MLERIRDWAHQLKADVLALYYAGRDSRTPTPVKVLAICIAAYALSPIDLIPDFIPILGYLDDLIIVPLGIMLVVRWMPVSLMTEYRAKAQRSHRLQANWAMGAMIIAIWLITGMWLLRWVVNSL